MQNPIVLEDLDVIHKQLGNYQPFHDSTIVITGAAGFLGYYITQYLVRYAEALKIKKIICLDTFFLEKPKWLKQLTTEYSHVLDVHTFDISKDDITLVSASKNASFVIHAASIASPTFYRQHPVETIDANVWGLRRLLDFYKEDGLLKGFLFFSSSEIYGDPEPQFIPTNEEYRGSVSCNGPRACYDEAKRFGETICCIYAKKFNMPISGLSMPILK